MRSYEWCGLNINSAFELPLRPIADSATDAIEIATGPVPATLADPVAIFPLFQARPNELLLNIPQVARFLIENGDRITVEPHAQAGPDDICTFLLGSALGAICHQRGLLPLHASAVRVGDGCVAFGGASGAGKSTIAAFLATRGHALVADDESVVSVRADGVPVVRRGPARVKLWKDGVDQLRADATGLARVRGRLDKYHLPVDTDGIAEPLPLRRLYLLLDGPAVKIKRFTAFEALDAVRRTVYRRQFVEPLDRVGTCFRLCAAVAAAASVAVLVWPRGFNHLSAVLEELEDEWSLQNA